MTPLALHLQPADWLQLFVYYLSLSLLAVGGAISTAPDMHRHLVGQQGWLTDPQFSASIAIAQAAPGPNVLFIAVDDMRASIDANADLSAELEAEGFTSEEVVAVRGNGMGGLTLLVNDRG